MAFVRSYSRPSNGDEERNLWAKVTVSRVIKTIASRAASRDYFSFLHDFIETVYLKSAKKEYDEGFIKA